MQSENESKVKVLPFQKKGTLKVLNTETRKETELSFSSLIEKNRKNQERLLKDRSKHNAKLVRTLQLKK